MCVCVGDHTVPFQLCTWFGTSKASHIMQVCTLLPGGHFVQVGFVHGRTCIWLRPLGAGHTPMQTASSSKRATLHRFDLCNIIWLKPSNAGCTMQMAASSKWSHCTRLTCVTCIWLGSSKPGKVIWLAPLSRRTQCTGLICVTCIWSGPLTCQFMQFVSSSTFS